MEKHWTAVCGYFDALSNASSLPEACQIIRDVLRNIVAVYDQTDLGALTEGRPWEFVLTTHSRLPLLSESTALLCWWNSCASKPRVRLGAQALKSQSPMRPDNSRWTFSTSPTPLRVTISSIYLAGLVQVDRNHGRNPSVEKLPRPGSVGKAKCDCLDRCGYGEDLQC
jgi:hypothetical protein